MNPATLPPALLLALSMVLFGCGDSHDHAHADDHSHEHGEDAGHEHEGEAGDPAATRTAAATTEIAALYSCPMHPEIQAAEAGRCSKCNMFLTRPDSDHGHEHADGEDHAHDDHSHEGGDGDGRDEDDNGHDQDDHSHEHGDRSHEH